MIGFTPDDTADTIGPTRGFEKLSCVVDRVMAALVEELTHRTGCQVAEPSASRTRSEPQPPAPPVVLPEGRLTFLELTDDVCHFPVGDGPHFLFCGKPITKAPYCSSCAAIAYRGHGDYRERKVFRMPI